MHHRPAAPELPDAPRAAAARPDRGLDRRGGDPRPPRVGDRDPLPPRHRRSADGSAARSPQDAKDQAPTRSAPVFKADVLLAERSADATPVCDASWRTRSKFSGRIRSVSVRRVDGAPTLECTLSDGSGSLLLVFQGRSQIPGIVRGARRGRGGDGGLVAAQARHHQPRLRARRRPGVRGVSVSAFALRTGCPLASRRPKTGQLALRPRRTTDVARTRGTDREAPT